MRQYGYLVCSGSKMHILEPKCGCYIETNPQTILGKPSTHLYHRNAMHDLFCYL